MTTTIGLALSITLSSYYFHHVVTRYITRTHTHTRTHAHNLSASDTILLRLVHQWPVQGPAAQTVPMKQDKITVRAASCLLTNGRDCWAARYKTRKRRAMRRNTKENKTHVARPVITH